MDTGIYDFCLICVGALVIIVALFKREILIQEENFEIILILCVLLFVAGLVLHFANIGRTHPVGALLTPLLTLGQYRLFRRIFVKQFQREPRDTSINWGKGIFWDRLFNLAYFIPATWLLMILLFASQRLAEAGW